MLEHAAEQVAARRRGGRERALHARGDIGIGVDLPVRMVQGDADRLPAVLEREDLLDALQCRQRGRALGPRLDDGARATRGLRRERPRRLGAEAHDLAASVRGCGALEADAREVGDPEVRAERRRAVLEHGDVVAIGDLAGIGGRLRGERIGLRRRQDHAVLPGGGDRDPVAGQHVLPHGRGRRSRIEQALVDASLGAENGVRVVEVDQLAPVGETSGALQDAGGHSPTIAGT
ncbi:hypothetical protein GCM10025881_27480 [Pseudolysinimonas kribbensis]|uniref:Uncharacterized protein n=1 Tax=Pseudolysinimonas kribbensis TaxID=433641 RepID=A0ABQ6K6B0_9MICO|nr:hypothetical protein GCM10025881_27480 [Pseudolysinimonas kribbensis]